MTDQRLTIFFDGREALPVRAISFVTGWHRFTPDVLAWYLAQDPDRFTEWDKPLTAYHLIGGIAVPVLPREWDDIVAGLNRLDAETRTKPDAQGQVLWREQSVQKLFAGVFVWLDEFVPVFKARCQRVQDVDKRPSDLTLSPLLDDAIRAMVMEGFTKPVALDSSPATKAGATAPEAVKTNEKRQDRRLKQCEDAGLTMPKSCFARLPNGVGQAAKREGVTRQSFTTDVKAALKRRESAKREGVTVHKS